MYFAKSKETLELTGGWPVAAAVSVCVFLTVLFGVNSGPVSTRAHAAAQAALRASRSRTGRRSQPGEDRHFPVKRSGANSFR